MGRYFLKQATSFAGVDYPKGMVNFPEKAEQDPNFMKYVAMGLIVEREEHKAVSIEDPKAKQQKLYDKLVNKRDAKKVSDDAAKVPAEVEVKGTLKIQGGKDLAHLNKGPGEEQLAEMKANHDPSVKPEKNQEDPKLPEESSPQEVKAQREEDKLASDAALKADEVKTGLTAAPEKPGFIPADKNVAHKSGSVEELKAKAEAEAEVEAKKESTKSKHHKK